jgi:hypothetical protein
MFEPLAVSFGQREAGNVDDERRVLARGVRCHGELFLNEGSVMKVV